MDAARFGLASPGCSIRSIERTTGVNRNTIMSLGLRVGAACAAIMDEKMRDLPCKRIEVDEIWGFIGAKKRNVTKAHAGKNYGDIWTFIALDADTKLIPSFVVGQRDLYHARTFMTPAMAAGIEHSHWTVAELVKRCGE